MQIDEQILAIEADILTKEPGSKDWKEAMELLNKFYSIKLEQAKLATAADAEEVKQAAEDRRFRLTILKDIGVGVGGALLIKALDGWFQLRCIDEISEYEKSDAYTGMKRNFLPKGRSLSK